MLPCRAFAPVRLFLAAALAGCLALVLTGCGMISVPSTGTSTPIAVTPAAATLGGVVHGGQQPVSGATVKLWAAGVTGASPAGYGANSTLVATTTSSSAGAFSFDTSGNSPCTTGQYLYITAQGGNSGGGTNSSLALMAALPTPCVPATTGALVVQVNEVTTVAAVTALQQFMSITPGGSTPWKVGAPASNVKGLANAFIQSGVLASIATGTSAAFTQPTTIGATTYGMTVTPPVQKINMLADILAYCVNTTGGTPCTNLFTDVTPVTTPATTAPTDTIQAMYYLATNPAGLTMPNHGMANSPLWLCTTYELPNMVFPSSTSCATTLYPTDWALLVQWGTPTGTGFTLSQMSAIAFDASGNLWTGETASSGSLTSVNYFNQAGNLLIAPPTTGSGTIVGGVGFSSYSGSTTFFPDATHENAGAAQIAVDLNGNAWYAAWDTATNSSTAANIEQPLTVGANTEGILVELVPNVSAGTVAVNGYLAQYSEGVAAIDPSGNIFIGGAENNGGTAGYYTGEYTNAGVYVGSIYQAPETATSGTYAGNNVVSEIVSSNTNASTNYVWTPGNTDPAGTFSACTNTITGTNNTIMGASTNNAAAGWDPGATAVTSKIITLPTSPSSCVTYIAADQYGNLWGSDFATGGYIEYIDINPAYGGSLAAPIVTQFASGAATSGVGGLSEPSPAAIDGVGRLWVGNSCNGGQAGAGGVSEFVPTLNASVSPATMSLVALSPNGTNGTAEVCGFGSTPTNSSQTTFNQTEGVYIDSSGNVWAATGNGTVMDYFVGLAAPVVTPLVTMVKNNDIGVRP